MTEPLSGVAFVFPGQGSQVVGMGRDLAERYPEAKAAFDEADDALGFALSNLCFEGPEDELRLTANLQPALLTVSTATHRALGLTPTLGAGHSLGEYSAVVASGAMAFADAVVLVQKRGIYMQEAVPAGLGMMAAVLGANIADIERVCAEASEATGKVAQVANLNCPGQVVISGDKAAVEKAMESFKRAQPLPVSAPFHSSLMVPAEERLATDLDAVAISDPAFPIVNNVGAEKVTTADAIREGLKRQVSRSVLWQTSVERMIADHGIGTFVEVGPRGVLLSMLRRIDKGAKRVPVEDAESLEKAREALASAPRERE